MSNLVAHDKGYNIGYAEAGTVRARQWGSSLTVNPSHTERSYRHTQYAAGHTWESVIVFGKIRVYT